MSTRRRASVRESVEGRDAEEDVEMRDQSDDEDTNDVDAEGDADDVEGEEEGEESRDLHHTISELSTYLCQFEEE
jgi:hypothetical protein